MARQLLLLSCGLHAAAGLVVPSLTRLHARACTRHLPVQSGLFDMFKESEASKAAKDDAWKTQQEMLARRRDPAKMKEYEDATLERRRKTQQEMLARRRDAK